MPTDIDREEVRRLIALGVPVIEVLGREEYEYAHLPGAVHIPLRKLDRDTTQALRADRSVIVYCNDFQ
ncbi:MAG TPA: rhodanese-like domain-containing protein [Chloroflexota bacterium]|jgi:rhodanese-related sulfurtransferase